MRKMTTRKTGQRGCIITWIINYSTFHYPISDRNLILKMSKVTGEKVEVNAKLFGLAIASFSKILRYFKIFWKNRIGSLIIWLVRFIRHIFRFLKPKNRCVRPISFPWYDKNTYRTRNFVPPCPFLGNRFRSVSSVPEVLEIPAMSPRNLQESFDHR